MWESVVLALALPWFAPAVPEPPAEMAWVLMSVSIGKVEDPRRELKPFPGEVLPLEQVRFPHIDDGLKPFPGRAR